MKRKPRLDELLVMRGLFGTVHDAQAAVLAGEVIVGEHRETSAGRRVSLDTPVRLKATSAYASRGGEKLAKALQVFDVEVAGCTCIDLGASTGGFTDCLLQRGAKRVVAIDVGEALMRWELQQDERVDYHYGTDVRGLDPDKIGGPFDVAVADLSFISLTRVLFDVTRLLKPGGAFISLIKPQFEVAREDIEEGGIVRDTRAHEQALRLVLEASARTGLLPQALDYSPITGAKGNIEFLYWAKNYQSSLAHNTDLESVTIGEAEISKVVHAAHEQLVRR